MKRSWLFLSLIFMGGEVPGVDSQTLCSCGHPCDLVLFGPTIDTVEVFEACNTITVASGFQVVPPGSVTLRAGEEVILDNGSSVEAGGKLRVVIDPALSCDETVDGDADGFDACLDCDDTDFFVNPGATEVCDGVDNNCDGQVDEGFCSPCDLSGLYAITPPVSLSCAFGFFNVNVSELSLLISETSLFVPAGGGIPNLAGTITCPDRSFNAVGSVAGDCTEAYTLSGSFSGDNTWSGTLSIDFQGDPFFCVDCTSAVFPISGSK